MAASMLSGLLIGSEFHTMKPAAARGRVLQLIARLPQQDLYRRAAAAFGWEVEVLDAHALYGAGVRQLLVAAC
jgi:2-keto-3-deoxy-galactonokinase